MIISGKPYHLSELSIRKDQLWADCQTCGAVGRIWNLPFNPSERAGWATCPDCEGDGEIELNPTEDEFEEVVKLKGELT